MLELLNKMPPFIDTNNRVVDMEMYSEAETAHRTGLKFYITRDQSLADKSKLVWRVGYAYSGLPELSQIAVRNEDLEVALNSLLEIIE